MSRELNAPVLPDTKKVNVIVIENLTLTGKYSFLFDNDFTEAIQMNQREHACVCLPLKPMLHFCCPGCLEGRYVPTQEDRIDLGRVLGNYSFRERNPVRAVDQILDLMIRTLPLALFAYGRGHQTVTKKIGITTLFFTDIDSVHRFAGHIIHACEDYYYHEEYLHTIYHPAMSDSDWSPIKSAHHIFGHLQITRNRLYNRVMMSYLGGGVGIGYVEPRTMEVVGSLKQDYMVETCRGAVGAYVATNDTNKPDIYKAQRYLLIPQNPISAAARWGPE